MIPPDPPVDAPFVSIKPPQICVKRYGGKARIATWVTSHFPEHHVYLEPFCGSCSVLFRKKPAPIEMVNDIDKRLMSLFETLRSRPKELAALLWATPYCRDNWRKEIDGDALEDARQLISESVQFYCGRQNSSTWSVSRTQPRNRTWADWAKRILPAAARLKDVVLLCEDAITAIKRVSQTKSALIYADPPYLGHEDEYSHSVDYLRMVNTLKACKAKVIVSEYEEALPYFKGWRVVSRTLGRHSGTHTGRKGSQKTEFLIMNFNE